MDEITYEAGVADGVNYAIRNIENAMNNPALDILTPRQVLGILLATLKMKED